MRIFRINETAQNQFAEIPEIVMDRNFSRSGSNFYRVIS